MYLNIIFLLIGLTLSIGSKVFQFFTEKTKFGDLLVIFAAVFFVLAILHTIPAYKELLLTQEGMKKAIKITLLSCLMVVCFQMFTMITFGYGERFGLFFIIPSITCLLLLLQTIYK